MARLIGGVLSRGSGRLGGHVLAVSNGQQIIREYQPNVANPRTSLQRIQRSKIVLAGKLSKLTPDAVIIGMGASKRDRRSAFTRNIIKQATASFVGDEARANLAYDKLVFSMGQMAGGVSATLGAVAAGAVTVTPSWGSNVDAVMVVVVEENEELGEYIYINYAISTTSGTATSVSLSGMADVDKIQVYLIPLVAKASAGSVGSYGVQGPTTGYLAGNVYAQADVFDHMASQYVGAVSA